MPEVKSTALYLRWSRLAKDLGDEIGSNEPDQANLAYGIEAHLRELANHPEMRHRYDDKAWRDDHG